MVGKREMSGRWLGGLKEWPDHLVLGSYLVSKLELVKWKFAEREVEGKDK